MEERKATLKGMRKFLNLKQEEVAQALGVAVSTVRNWENGKCPPPITKAYEICKLYNVPIDFIEWQ